MNPILQHAIERVERSGGSHEGVGREKKLQAPELQLHPRTSNITGPEGAGDAVEDFFSDEERDTADAETDAETGAEESWCPRSRHIR